ncbi:MAG TPA: hypothetical protein VKX29_05160 [Brumimicrobium sp.]|nr:hypothetical protein [Brumimicrobium sp.]
MDSFYSILYYKTNALTDELVSIGMLAGGGQGPFLYISNVRMELLRKSLHPNTYLSVKRHLKALKEKVDNHRNESVGLLLFDPVFSVEQMEVLSNRTKSSIVYSQPTTINEWLDIAFFEKLIKSFFGDTVKSNINKRPVFHLKWKAFYHSNKFKNWDKDISISALVPELALGITIDLVLHQEKKIIKGLDFDLSKSSLQKKIYEIEVIRNSLPNYNFTIVHPTPKKQSGKDAFLESKLKNNKIDFLGFSQFKNLN